MLQLNQIDEVIAQNSVPRELIWYAQIENQCNQLLLGNFMRVVFALNYGLKNLIKKRERESFFSGLVCD